MVAATPGESLAEKYERWHHQIHCVNRVQYALFAFRDRAFYLLRRATEDLELLPITAGGGARRSSARYFQAMKLGYPVLYAQPTRRNSGATGLACEPVR